MVGIILYNYLLVAFEVCTQPEDVCFIWVFDYLESRVGKKLADEAVFSVRSDRSIFGQFLQVNIGIRQCFIHTAALLEL